MSIDEAKQELDKQKERKHSERIAWVKTKIMTGEIPESDLTELTRYSYLLTGKADEVQLEKIISKL
jgi:hypothetical protein